MKGIARNHNRFVNFKVSLVICHFVLKFYYNYIHIPCCHLSDVMCSSGYFIVYENLS
jgi:hypothetical protein